MEWLNYHHLYYFWVITQEGSLTKAAARLRVSHSTFSVQIRMLEDFLGSQLFERKGKKLILTSFGSEMAAYASDIFHLGSELVDVARGRLASKNSFFRVGVVGTIPRTVVYRLLEPALAPFGNTLLQIRQDTFENLLLMLAANRIHLILSDIPPSDGTSYRVHTHALGETDILLYGTPELAVPYSRGFPQSLDGAPMIFTSSGTTLRRSMEQWFVDRNVRVKMVMECDDASLIRVFGSFGLGLFPVRTALRAEVEKIYDAVLVGPMSGVRERYYAVSLEQRIRNPLVARIVESAGNILFKPEPPIGKRKTKKTGTVTNLSKEGKPASIEHQNTSGKTKSKA